jgi:hypothetical protein
VFRGTEYPWEFEGRPGGPRFTYRTISSFILYVSKDPTLVAKNIWTWIKETPYAAISESSPSLELELSSSSSDWALALALVPPSLGNVSLVLISVAAPALL